MEIFFELWHFQKYTYYQGAYRESDGFGGGGKRIGGYWPIKSEESIAIFRF